MADWQYLYAGLKISSGIELPEWEKFQCSDGIAGPDIIILTETAQELFADETDHIVSNDEYCFLMPRIGRFRVKGGNRIEVTHLPDVEPHRLRLFLLGSAWGALCYQRGMLAVHAGAVQIGSEAILVCARQGRGKSTMTACLLARGHGLISDDLCCVDMPMQGQPIVHPSTQRLRLWEDTLVALGWGRETYHKDFFRIDKYLVPWTGVQTTRPVSLRAIYLLEWGELKLERLSGVNALQRFIAASTYRGGLLQSMGKSATYWQSCLKLLEKVPVWELTRPKDLTYMDTVAATIEENIGYTVLTEYV